MIQTQENVTYQEAVHQALEVLQAATRGNLEMRIHCIEHTGELGEMLRAINRILDITDEFAREAQASMESASQGRFYRRVMEWGMPGRFLLASRALNEATGEMERRHAELVQAQENQLEVANVMAQAIETFSQSTATLRATATGLSEVSTRSVDSANALAESSEQASRNIQTIASTTEELAASVREIQRMTNVSATTTAGAVESSQLAVSTIKGLCEASRKVDRIVGTISQVASQTRMLALNATIEAARAGDLGRGFSVVASEVKGLAHQTSEATQSITVQIEGLQSSSLEAAEVVEQVGKDISSLNQISNEIAEAVLQQQLAARDMSQETCQAAERSRTVYSEGQNVKALAQETHEAAASVSREAESLTRQVKLMMEQTKSLVSQISTQVSAHDLNQAKTVMDFDSAIQAHSAWKLKLSNYLRGPDGSLKPTEIEPDHLCGLGKWIYGEGSKWSRLPEFVKLKAEHARFHKAASEVVRQADTGRCTAEATALGGDSEFSQASSTVVRAIMDIRRRTENV